MNIVKTGDGRFIEVQGTAEAMPFGRDALDTLLDLADHGIRQLIEKQRAIVGHLVQAAPAYAMHRAAAQRSTTPVGPMMALASEQALCALEFWTPDGCRGSTRGSRRWFAPFEIEDGTNAVDRADRRVARRATSRRAPTSRRSPLDMRGAAVRAARVGGAARRSRPARRPLRRDRPADRRTRRVAAVGMANGANPIAIIVPCHRVIGANGTLTGYGGGLDRKTWLLDHERPESNSP